MMRYFYLRDKRNNPVGCVAIYEYDNEAPKVAFQISTCNPCNAFSKARGRHIASARLTLDIMGAIAYSVPDDGHVKWSIMTIIADNYYFPDRARRAARLWLKKISDTNKA